MYLERYNMDKLLKVVAEQNEEAESSFQLKRIADALEEVLQLVKADQAKTAERYRKYDNEDDMLDDLSKPWKEDKPKNDLPDNINGRPYKGRL